MDITKFCATNDPRSYMHKPMRHDGYLYATNRHIAVRIADDPAIEAGPMPQNLEAGHLPIKLAMTFDDRLSFVLTERGEIKRLDFLDVIRDQVKADEHEDAQSIFDAEFALMTGELLRLLPAVVGAMGGEIQRAPDLVDQAKEAA